MPVSVSLVLLGLDVGVSSSRLVVVRVWAGIGSVGCRRLSLNDRAALDDCLNSSNCLTGRDGHTHDALFAVEVLKHVSLAKGVIIFSICSRAFICNTDSN